MKSFNTLIENMILKCEIEELKKENENLKYLLFKEKQKESKDYTLVQTNYSHKPVKKPKIKPKPIEKK